MLPVSLENIITDSTVNSEQWLNVFTLSFHAHYGNLLRECDNENVIATIKSLDLMLQNLDPNLISLFGMRVRRHPYTTAHCLFPALNIDSFFDYLVSENIIESYSYDLVAEDDDFKLDASSNIVEHDKKGNSDNAYTGSYLTIKFISGVFKTWVMDEYELSSAFEAWQDKVFGGMDVFLSTREWAGFVLLLRSLKTLDVQDVIISHKTLPTFKSRILALYSDYFTYFKEATSDKFANSVKVSKYVTTEGSELEIALRNLDETNVQPNNVVVLGSVRLNNDAKNVTDESNSEIDIQQDEMSDFSDLDFGVL